jgi:hypothetical protein
MGLHGVVKKVLIYAFLKIGFQLKTKKPVRLAERNGLSRQPRFGQW